MKATIQAARDGVAKHNDRSFNYAAEEHIDPARVKDNIYMSYKNLPFTEAETAYYHDHYSDWLKTQNDRYRKQGNKAQCRTMSMLLKGKNTRPEEVILQIGDWKQSPDAKVFEACVRDYLQEIQKYSSNYHVLDVAIHNDEATPHAHIRAVWDYTDKDGNLHIGQTRALQELGISAPDRDMPGDSRFNNRKMEMTRQMRELWHGICEARGIKLDKVPNLSNREHKKIRDLILERQTAEIQKNEETLEQQQQAIAKNQQALALMDEEIRRAEKELEEKAGRDRARRAMQQKELAAMLGSMAAELMPEEEQRVH